MLRLQCLSSPLTTTQNPKFHLSPSLSSLRPSTKRTAFNPNIPSKKLSVKCATLSTSSNRGTFPPRFFVGHSIYKGKAALTVEPRAPEFISLDSGAFKLSKEGFVLLQFAPAAGVRQYDWNRKQVFSLSVMEIGTLVSLGRRDSCEFFHYPFKGKSEEGKVRKVLKVMPLPDGSGHFFNLSVQKKLLNVDESTRAEYTVLITAFNFILPYLLGWHAFANSIKPEDTGRVNSANSRYGSDFEWSR